VEERLFVGFSEGIKGKDSIYTPFWLVFAPF
jgi:hypothetical protein